MMQAESAQPDTRGTQVSTALVRALVECVKQRGTPPERLLPAEALALLYAEPVERSFSLARFQALLARAGQLTNDPAFGLHCGLRASEASYGLMAPLVAHAPNLRRALELVIQFGPLLVDGPSLRLTEQLGSAQVQCELPKLGEGACSFAEFFVAGLVRTLLSFGCDRSEILRVSFTHARPVHHHLYTLALPGSVCFGQDRAGVEFSPRALDRPHLHRHTELHALVLAQAEHNLQRLHRPLTYAERVRTLLQSRAASALPDMVQAAHELGVSVRSLRRHLDAEGTSYRELTQSMLHAYACTRLRNPSVSLQHIACELGFSDVTAFHRAFRRWADLTPAEYRSAFVGAAELERYPQQERVA